MTGAMIVSQLGARMHYAVPRILERAGRLEHCYTDICATKSWPRLLRGVPAALRPAFVKRLAGRVPHGVPPRRLTSFPGFGLRYALESAAARTLAEQSLMSLRAGRRFSQLVVRRGFLGASALFGYSGECLEQLVAARARGLRTVVEQTVAPREILDSLLLEERDRFGDWCFPEPHCRVPEYAEREKAEWANADLIVCGSAFVRDGVIAEGGAPERSVVVPYGVDAKFAPRVRRHFGPLRVLCVGEIGLRKGSPYVLEAARRLRGRAVFRMVGGCSLPPATRARLAAALDLIGPVPRSEMHRYWQRADVFLLPSLCEGSATVVYEALAAGLPVICTPNTGSVVRDRIDGFIVPVRDTDAIVEALELLASDRDRQAQMSESAAARAAEFTVAAYGGRLLATVTPLLDNLQ
jgi:glycosyltransferase involved in cell wall biosynthesis